MRWVCPQCGHAVNVGLEHCPACQSGVPPEQRVKVTLPPPPPRAHPVPELAPPEARGVRAVLMRTYLLFVGFLLAILLIWLFWRLLL